MALAICSSLERSDGHLIQVTVTWEVTSRWPKKWRHLKKNFEKFFFTFSGILGNFKRFHVKNFFFPSDVTWSDEQMAKEVTSLEVTVIWKKWRHFLQVTSRWPKPMALAIFSPLEEVTVTWSESEVIEKWRHFLMTLAIC